jgi:hypothetical protein
VDAWLRIRGSEAMAVLTGAGMVVFVGFFPLLLLLAGTIVHPSIWKLHFAFIGSAVFGVIAFLLSIWIGKFVFSRLFASFAWRIAVGICLMAWSVWLVIWLGQSYLVDVVVYATFLVLSVYGAATGQKAS